MTPKPLASHLFDPFWPTFLLYVAVLFIGGFAGTALLCARIGGGA